MIVLYWFILQIYKKSLFTPHFSQKNAKKLSAIDDISRCPSLRLATADDYYSAIRQ